jgi:hypothetical protein
MTLVVWDEDMEINSEVSMIYWDAIHIEEKDEWEEIPHGIMDEGVI